MDARIADKHDWGRMGHEPLHSGVGQRVLGEDGLIAFEVGAHGAVEAEESARREASQPEVVAVFETRSIKLGSPFLRAELIQAPPIEIGTGLGQMRARRKRSVHGVW